VDVCAWRPTRNSEAGQSEIMTAQIENSPTVLSTFRDNSLTPDMGIAAAVIGIMHNRSRVSGKWGFSRSDSLYWR
jgi:hypothetical protein